MGNNNARQHPAEQLRRIRRRLQRLDKAHPDYKAVRMQLLSDISLAKHQLQKSRPTTQRRRRPAQRKKTAARKKRPTTAPVTSPTTGGSKINLAKIFSPKNLQDSLKNVGNIRNTVKNWLQYLQQADHVLDTLYLTSNSLKETGVLEKLIRNKGKNLSTEDFTNILIALMNTPMGAQMFKSSEDSSETKA